MKENIDGTVQVCSLDMSTPFIKLVGGSGTGKTYNLLQRASFLASQGVEANQIVLLCSTPASANAIRQRAKEMPEIQGIEIATVAKYAVDMLRNEQAKQCTQRNPRILADFEHRILMEDMKVCGLKPKRLREMLKYFYKELTELGDEKESFIQSSEESDVFQTLQENLRLRGAMLREELTGVAFKFMRDFPDEASFFKRDFVLVDDYQNLNCTSQLFVEKLAGKSLVIAGCTNEQLATTEPYPCLQGFRAFELTHKSTQVIYLDRAMRCPDRINAMANSLVVEGGLNNKELVSSGNITECETHLVEWTYPNDEFLGIAGYIKHRLQDAQHLIHAKDIFVAVPNRVWGRAIAKVLKANHIEADEVTSYHALQGDPRVNEKCLDLQAYTRLNLAANPQDVVAWRSWCGFGDYLTNSNHWFRLEKYAQDANIGIIEALERAALLTETELFTGANVLVGRYLAGKEFIAAASGKQGFALLNMCSPVQGEVPPAAFMSLVEPVSGFESAQELLKRAKERIELCFSERDAVRVGLLQMSCGMEFDTVIITGAVEGFYPARETIGTKLDDSQVQDIRLQERRAWYSAMTKARYAFVCSTIQKDESNTAESLGMYAHRIRMENGKSLAILAPTPYVEEFGQTAPCIESKL